MAKSTLLSAKPRNYQKKKARYSLVKLFDKLMLESKIKDEIKAETEDKDADM